MEISARTKSKFNEIFELINTFSGVQLTFDDSHDEFDIFNYSDQNFGKCPFSLWISKDKGDKVFFNIGEKEIAASILHFHDTSDYGGIIELERAIKIFSNSQTDEVKLFCRGRLKKVTYYIVNAGMDLKYTYLQEGYVLCLKKEKISKKYEAWCY